MLIVPCEPLNSSLGREICPRPYALSSMVSVVPGGTIVIIVPVAVLPSGNTILVVIAVELA